MKYAVFADMNLHWYLPPLVAIVSLVYSATRYEDWRLILGLAIRWAGYVLGFLGGAYAAVWLLFQALDRNNYWFAVPVVGVAIFLFGPSWKRKPKADKAVAN